MANKSPAFLFYSQDFLVGTMDMTDEEVGTYIRLLCRQHVKGNIHPKFMKNLSEEILSKFVQDSQGNYYNKRLKQEIDKRNKYSESRSSNRSKRSQKKEHMKKICSTHDDTYDKHMENENENIYIDLLDHKDLTDQEDPKKNKVGEWTKEIISYLNYHCGTKYKASSKKTQELIQARINEGAMLEDFKTVIDKKVADWTGTEYEKFLRPLTLFGTKFESYLNQKITRKGTGNESKRTDSNTEERVAEPDGAGNAYEKFFK